MTLAVLVSVAPLLALLCALLLRRYPGEQAITRLRARRVGIRRAPAAVPARCGRYAATPRPSFRAAAGSSPPRSPRGRRRAG